MLWHLALLLLWHAAVLTQSKPVLELTDETFERTIAGQLVLVQFDTASCEVCRTVAIGLDRYSDSTLKQMTLARVVCSNPASQAACAKHGGQKFPSFVLFIDGNAYHYRGRPNALEISDWASHAEALARGYVEDPHYVALTDDKFPAAVQGKVTLFVFHQTGQDITSLLDYIAAVAPKTEAVTVDCSSQQTQTICATLAPIAYPSIKLLHKIALYTYYGPYDLEEMGHWVSVAYAEQAPKLFFPEGTLSSSSNKYLTDDTFPSAIAGGKAFIKFAMAVYQDATWEAVAQELKGVMVSTVNCAWFNSSRTCAAHASSGFPLYKLFIGNVYYNYWGMPELKKFVDWANEGYTPGWREVPPPPQDAVFSADLNDDTFTPTVRKQPTLVYMFDSNCTTCEELDVLWEQLQKPLTNVFVAFINCSPEKSKNACAALDSSQLPIFKMVDNDAVYTYRGTLTFEAVLQWASARYKDRFALPLPPVLIAYYDDRYVKEATDANIHEFETSEKTVLLEFYAAWCVHCDRLVPAYNKLAAIVAMNFPDLLVAKCDVTYNRMSTKRYDITGFPRLKVFKNGRMYHYAGHRTVEGMLAFLRKPTGESFPIPGEWTSWDETKATVKYVVNDIRQMFEKKRKTVAYLYFGGLLSALLIMALVLLLMVGLKLLLLGLSKFIHIPFVSKQGKPKSSKGGNAKAKEETRPAKEEHAPPNHESKASKRRSSPVRKGK